MFYVFAHTVRITFYIISASNELVFLNFYAEWCRFSNLLAPIFNEAADKVYIQSINIYSIFNFQLCLLSRLKKLFQRRVKWYLVKWIAIRKRQ